MRDSWSGAKRWKDLPPGHVVRVDLFAALKDSLAAASASLGLLPCCGGDRFCLSSCDCYGCRLRNKAVNGITETGRKN